MPQSHVSTDISGSLLDLRNLSVGYKLEKGYVNAVSDISFSLKKSTCLGLVGESGCGESTIVKSIMRLLPYNAVVSSGEISLSGKNILTCSKREMDRLRWEDISLVTQSAMSALNPVARISKQMIEIFKAHTNLEKSEIVERCMSALEKVGINKNRFFDYPHQFSGGMRQRVIIAMAIVLDPGIIIADEPTTALDVIMQAQIIQVLKELSVKEGISIIMITHNIAVVAEICDEVGVMYAGSLAEYGDINQVFQRPLHPYTIGLQGAFPTIKDLKKKLVSIPGSPPQINDDFSGCFFQTRCPFVQDQCMSARPQGVYVTEKHYVACHRYREVEKRRAEIRNLFEQ